MPTPGRTSRPVIASLQDTPAPRAGRRPRLGHPRGWPTSSRPGSPATRPTTARPTRSSPGRSRSSRTTTSSPYAARGRDRRRPPPTSPTALRERRRRRSPSTRASRTPSRCASTPSPSSAGYDEQLRALRVADRRQPGIRRRLPLLLRLRAPGRPRPRRAASCAARPPPARAPTEAFVLTLRRGPGPARAGRLGRGRDASCDRRCARRPGYVPALVSVAPGSRRAGATSTSRSDRWRDVVARLPLPEYLTELGELLLHLGRPDGGRRAVRGRAHDRASCSTPTASTPTWRPRSSRPTTDRPPRR